MNRTRLLAVAVITTTVGFTSTSAADAESPATTTPVCPTYRANDQYPLRLCDKGDDVRILQAALRSVDFTLDVDGHFGPHTLRVVQEFQRRSGLAVDGLVGPGTRSALPISDRASTDTDIDGNGIIDPDESTYVPVSPPSTRCDSYVQDESYPLSLCDKGPAVRVAQFFLTASFAHLEVDGYFGPWTEYAVRNYQQIMGLAIDGLVGPQTWQSLTHAFTCGADRDVSGHIDPDEVELPQLFTDLTSFLEACGARG